MSTACGIFLSFLMLKEVHVYVPEWFELSQCFQNLCWPEIFCIPKVPQVDQRITAYSDLHGNMRGPEVAPATHRPLLHQAGLVQWVHSLPFGSGHRVKIGTFAWAVSLAGMRSFR